MKPYTLLNFGRFETQLICRGIVMSNNFSVGVDLGGTNLRIAAYSEGDSYLESVTLSTHLSVG